MRNFKYWEQINISNQPSGYNHILIKTWEDLVNLVKDIHHYHLYYTSYPEIMEWYWVLKQAQHNIENEDIKDLFPNALNVKKENKFFKDLITRFKIRIWKIPVCVLNKYQIKYETESIEQSYLPNRQKYIDKFWEDLRLWMQFHISLDESQLYFGSRNFKENFSWKNAYLADFIAFPVKLNTRVDMLNQSSMMLDVNFRRQASTYKLHNSKFFWLIKKSHTIEVKDPEKVRFEDSDIVSSSTSINLYKLFGYPRLQYYRSYLINPREKSIYPKTLLFQVIKDLNEEKKETP